MKFISKLNIDHHVLATLLFRSWAVLAGGVTILLIPMCLDSVQQGYYYTFASILALQVFFELGLNQVVVQIVAHEAAHLDKNMSDEFQRDSVQIARISQFKIMLKRWYLVAAVLFLGTVSIAGLIFFREGKLIWQHWAFPWALLVTATTINLYLSWKLAMVEGFSLVRDISHLRLKQSILGSFVMWGALISGWGLWSAAIIPSIAAVVTILWLRKNPAKKIMEMSSVIQPVNQILWKSDVFPFQWRIAVSWISGYLFFSLFTPITFSVYGPEEAGRIGFTLTIFSAILVIGQSWTYAKAPQLSGLIAKRESTVLLNQFKNVAVRSILATVFIVIIFLSIVWLLILLDVQVMHRVSSMTVFICLGIVTIINSGIHSAAVFMRAHKEEPMLAVSIVGGLLNALIVWKSASHSVEAMMLGYAAVTAFVSLPWTFKILMGYYLKHKTN